MLRQNLASICWSSQGVWQSFCPPHLGFCRFFVTCPVLRLKLGCQISRINISSDKDINGSHVEVAFRIGQLAIVLGVIEFMALPFITDEMCM